MEYFNLYMRTHLKLRPAFSFIGMTAVFYYGYNEIKEPSVHSESAVDDFLTISYYGATGGLFGFGSALIFPVVIPAAAIVSYNRWKKKSLIVKYKI